ncbi:MAG TPA: cupin domain-containing protein [Stellaceae bacterium]|nr:cupin domain-containing protein [Stellaceae bacterium]
MADTNPLDGPTDEPWKSTELLEVNGNKVRFRVMRDAEARWHTHKGSDEFFLILSGTVTIDTREGGEDGTVTSHTLQPGQMLAVHPGNEHRARCQGRATLVVIDAIDRLG